MSVSAQSWITPAVARLRAANPYVVDAALAALVLFAASLQWMFPDDGDDRLTWQGFLLGAGTAVRWCGGGARRSWRPAVSRCSHPPWRSTTRRRPT